jgi:hypothetical protein
MKLGEGPHRWLLNDVGTHMPRLRCRSVTRCAMTNPSFVIIDERSRLRALAIFGWRRWRRWRRWRLLREEEGGGRGGGGGGGGGPIPRPWRSPLPRTPAPVATLFNNAPLPAIYARGMTRSLSRERCVGPVD